MKLVEPSEIDENEFNDFIAEFKKAGEGLSPYSLNQKGLNFNQYIKSLNDESLGKGLPEGWVPASTYFLVDNSGRIYGAVNIRSRLTEHLKTEGGHIGYGIRPSARNKGCGSKILKLALEKIKELGIKKVLIACDKNNIASAKVILNNGGKLDSELVRDGKIVQRYWIKI
jgi:predicted acetyltransferase